MRNRPTRSTSWSRARPWLLVAALVVASLLLTDLSVVEQFALLAGLSGLALLAGGMRRPVATATPLMRASSLLPHAVAATTVLRDLDPVEYRRVELGSPWPVAVVGPTGVAVVGVATSAADGDAARSGLLALADAIRARVACDDEPRPVPVRVLLVMPAHAAAAPVDPDVQTISVDRLAGRIADGEVLPMPAVDRAFLRMADLALGAPVTN